VKTICDSGTNIVQDALNNRPMSILWCMKVLTYMVNCIGDIRPSDSEILETPTILQYSVASSPDNKVPSVADRVSVEDIGVVAALHSCILARRNRS
jgi:hypothetical protein